MSTYGMMTFTDASLGSRPRQLTAPGNEAGLVFGGQLGAATRGYSRASTALVPGQSAVRAMASGFRQHVSDINAAYVAGPGASLLEGHTIAPSENVTYAPNAAPSYPAVNAELTDTPIAMFRIVTALRASDIPGEGQLLFLKRPAIAASVMEIGDAAMTSIAKSKAGALPLRTLALNRAVDMNVMIGLHIASLNRLLTEQLLELLYTDPVTYFQKVTPHAIMEGHPDIECSGWFCDGGVRLEEMATGAPADKLTDGADARGNVFTGMRTGSLNGMPQKNLTVVRAGRVALQNIWDNRGVVAGAVCCLVAARYSPTTAPHAEDAHFVCTSKAGTFANAPPGVVAKVHLPSAKEIQAQASRFGATTLEYQLLQNVKHGFSPIQLFPVMVPTGGAPDASMRMSRDELGREFHDAMFMRLGRVLFPSYQNQPGPALENRDSLGFEPVWDGSRAMRLPLITDVLLDPYKEGAFAAM